MIAINRTPRERALRVLRHIPVRGDSATVEYVVAILTAAFTESDKDAAFIHDCEEARLLGSDFLDALAEARRRGLQERRTR